MNRLRDWSPPFTGLRPAARTSTVGWMNSINQSAARKSALSTLSDDSSGPGKLAVFTSLDGTLLDADTFEAGPVREVVDRLHEAGIPIIPMTVMTLDEVEPIARDLGMRHAMVIEAGGAIARWVDGTWEIEPCGPTSDALLDVVRDIENRSGANLLLYSALPELEAARLSGRSGSMLQASTRCRFSEPFVIESGEISAVMKAATSIGFSIRRGRRFYYLCHENAGAAAFTSVRDELGIDVVIGVGGSLIDLEFLTLAEIPIIVPRSDGRADVELVTRVPHARIASAAGPAGWAAAVNDAWQSIPATRHSASVS
ncbi:MAG TPA: hypothetical protein VNM92_14075 [Thermoanaerobaculia bacterium]|nr:hypothetical protein [Thermoanaerobaculia bacterium]